jgi:hypothetical protein
VNGKTYTQPLTVRMDPRVKTPPATLARQFALSKGLYDDIARARTSLDSVRALRASLRALRQRSAGDATAIDSLDREAGALEGGGGGFGGGGGGGGAATLGGVIGQLAQLYDALQEADVAPTTQLVAAVETAQRDASATIARWTAFRTRAVTRFGTQLRPTSPPG